MSKPDDSGPAFPSPDTRGYDGVPGMTLRDWFAGQALIGQLASCSLGYEYTGADAASKCARDTYKYADAMIAARNNLP